jgi:membrane protein
MPETIAPPTIRFSLRGTAQLLRRAAVRWDEDNAMRLSASLAMYTLLSLSPLLVITIKVVALILGNEQAVGQVHRQTESLLGYSAAAAVEGMITNTLKPDAGIAITIFSAVMLLVTASGVFNELRDSLNAIWGIAPITGRGIRSVLRYRLLSAAMVFVLGFLLLVSHALSIAMTVLSETVFGNASAVAILVDFFASTTISALLFAMLFRILPDARLTWGDVLYGSVVTAVLFKLGQWLQALYFTHGSTASAYGAAGSFIVVLLWIYYSCWIFFYGAELIEERAAMLGRRIEPSPGATRTQCSVEESWKGS